MPHKQLVVARVVVVVVNNYDGAGDMVEFMVGCVVKFVLGRETWWVYGRVRCGVCVRISEVEEYQSLGGSTFECTMKLVRRIPCINIPQIAPTGTRNVCAVDRPFRSHANT